MNQYQFTWWYCAHAHPLIHGLCPLPHTLRQSKGLHRMDSNHVWYCWNFGTTMCVCLGPASQPDNTSSLLGIQNSGKLQKQFGLLWRFVFWSTCLLPGKPSDTQQSLAYIANGIVKHDSALLMHLEKLLAALKAYWCFKALLNFLDNGCRIIILLYRHLSPSQCHLWTEGSNKSRNSHSYNPPSLYERGQAPHRRESSMCASQLHIDFDSGWVTALFLMNDNCTLFHFLGMFFAELRKELKGQAHGGLISNVTEAVEYLQMWHKCQAIPSSRSAVFKATMVFRKTMPCR